MAAGQRQALPAVAAARLEARTAARERRDWAESDRLRDALGELGVEVSDTSDGTTWRWREPS